jgi:hypothetical protein
MEVNEQLQEGLAKFGTISAVQAAFSSASVPSADTDDACKCGRHPSELRITQELLAASLRRDARIQKLG